MIHTQEELLAFLANDLFNKRQRLIRASQPSLGVFDDRTLEAMEAEYRAAEADYRDAKAAFARAMHSEKRSA